MRRVLTSVISIVLLSCLAQAAFCADAITDRESLKAEMTKQDLNMREGADTFWSGVIVGAVSAGVLIPVSVLVNMDTDSKKTVIGIVGGAMAGVTVVLLAWGGIEWLAANGRMDELKKMEKDLSFEPFISPLAYGGNAFGLELKAGF
jgi:hypothetical protein